MKQKCPFCGSQLFWSTQNGSRVVKCSGHGGDDCPFARKGLARTKDQLETVRSLYESGEVTDNTLREDQLKYFIERLRESELHMVRKELHPDDDEVEKTAEVIADKLEEYVQ